MSSKASLYPSLWDATPLALVNGLFLTIAALNWDYMEKFFLPMHVQSDDKYYVGPILFLIGQIFTLASCAFVYLLRRDGGDVAGPSWLRGILNALLCVFFLLAGLAIIVMGPAAITMREQMATVPEMNADTPR